MREQKTIEIAGEKVVVMEISARGLCKSGIIEKINETKSAVTLVSCYDEIIGLCLSDSDAKKIEDIGITNSLIFFESCLDINSSFLAQARQTQYVKVLAIVLDEMLANLRSIQKTSVESSEKLSQSSLSTDSQTPGTMDGRSS